ncbi:MAG: nucleotidyl transferase AbiEii/AbiGii toxin family protein [Chthoniobacterales bacterium]|nr:nucleotidyl transferase AbiEii/AbiGii toxin family protein [Chthoniobacterales bacterium]
MSEWMPSLERWLGSRGELQAAVEFTAAKTGFQPALVEKDFWCSVVLGRLYATEECPLVFKGGTLLSKAYVAFNRMSEDLDFTLPTAPGITRGVRSKRAREVGALVETATVGLLRTDEKGWQSFNSSTQHRITLWYPSVFGGEGSIKLEVGQREEPMREIAAVPLATLLRDPLFDEEGVQPVMAASLSREEAYAEKVRAALTRDEPAPRDLFDLDYAVQEGVLDWEDAEFLRLAARKVAMEKDMDWLAAERLETFQRLIEGELRPVLRPDTFAAFDFTRSVATLENLAAALRKHWPAE